MTNQEAIDELPSVTHKSETVTEFADRCRECGAKYGKLLKQEPRWIPVSERLPERSVWVLAYCKTKDGYEYQDVLLINKYSGLWSDADEFSDTVIAWMPLPEPYKAESEDKE